MCSSGWSGSYYVEQVDLKLTEMCLPLLPQSVGRRGVNPQAWCDFLLLGGLFFVLFLFFLLVVYLFMSLALIFGS